MSVSSDFPSSSEAVPETLPAKMSPRQEASNDMRECVERVLHTNARAPVSTYRVQMHKDFNFGNAQGIVGYLKKLGISDFYSSPISKPAPAACTDMTSLATTASILNWVEMRVFSASLRNCSGRD